MSTTQGKFVWYDLMTSDSKAAESFYRNVIGWDAKDSGMTDRSYTLLSIGPAMVGGLMPIPKEARAMGVQPRWSGYIAVDDVDAYAERVKAAAGAIHRAPEDILQASAASPSPPTRMARFSSSSKGTAIKRRSQRRRGRPAISAGMNCMRATGQAHSPSIRAFSAGPRPKPWIWARWASTRLSPRAAHRSAA